MPTEPGVSLLDAALAAGVLLEHQCRSGSCGTCIGRLNAGSVAAVGGRALSLLQSDIEAGYRLCCSALPVDDTDWSFDYPSSLARRDSPKAWETVVREIRWVSRSVIELTLELPRGAAFTFRAGQYVRVRIPGRDVERSLSMASPPQDLPVLRFLVRYIADGVLSEFLKLECRAGDALNVAGPQGVFVLPERPGPRVFVAGGSGLAPVMSMLDDIRLSGRGRGPLLLAFGVSSADDLFYLDELQLRRFWMPSLSVHIAADEPVQEVPPGVSRGTVVSLLSAGTITAGTINAGTINAATTALVCGPPGMIAAARAQLMATGIPPGNILSERFNPT